MPQNPCQCCVPSGKSERSLSSTPQPPYPPYPPGCVPMNLSGCSTTARCNGQYGSVGYQLTLAGIKNFDPQHCWGDCTINNGDTFTLGGVGFWSGGGVLQCNDGFHPATTFKLYYDGGVLDGETPPRCVQTGGDPNAPFGSWVLTVTDYDAGQIPTSTYTLTYAIPDAAWNCAGCNVFDASNLVALVGSPNCDWSEATLTVCPVYGTDSNGSALPNSCGCSCGSNCPSCGYSCSCSSISTSGGSGGGGGGGGVCSCVGGASCSGCGSSQPNLIAVSVAGLGAAGCGCDDLSLTAANDGGGCEWATPWFVFCGGISRVLIDAGSPSQLTFQYVPEYGWIYQAVFTSSASVCCGTTTWTFAGQDEPPAIPCDFSGATVTTTACDCCSSSSSSGSGTPRACDCTVCPHGVPEQWTFTMAGVTGSCGGSPGTGTCGNYNGTFVLTYGTDRSGNPQVCTWTTLSALVPCDTGSGSGFVYAYELLVDASGYHLTAYSNSYFMATWDAAHLDCTGDNQVLTLNPRSVQGCGTWPNTVTISLVGGFVAPTVCAGQSCTACAAVTPSAFQMTLNGFTGADGAVVNGHTYVLPQLYPTFPCAWQLSLPTGGTLQINQTAGSWVLFISPFGGTDVANYSVADSVPADCTVPKVLSQTSSNIGGDPTITIYP